MANQFWNDFHDGGLESIDGVFPGDVTLGISVRYLREQFGGEGIGFVVKLADCSRFEYQEFGGDTVADPAQIIRMGGLEIYGLISDGELVVVDCVDGTLTMSYASANLFLDSGEPVSAAAVAAASTAYWDAFSKRNARDGQGSP